MTVNINKDLYHHIPVMDMALLGAQIDLLKQHLSKWQFQNGEIIEGKLIK